MKDKKKPWPEEGDKTFAGMTIEMINDE